MDRIPARPDRLPWQRRLERKPPRSRVERELDAFITSAAWRRCRAYKLALDPLCELCKLRGDLVEARVVHHLQDRRDRPDLAYDLDNLQSLCAACHNAESARREHLRRQGR